MTLNLSSGIFPGLAKSYAYDNTNYIQADPVAFTIPAVTNGSAIFTAFTKKQLKSIIAVPTVAATANDQLTLVLTTIYPQTFGTATSGSFLGSGTYVFGGTTTGVVAGGTQTATGSCIVTIGTLTTMGTAPPFNPCYMPIAGGTYNVVVASASGTNTQNGFVFPQGPNGGLTINAGDVLRVVKGTDTVAVYQCEAELTFTPGTNLTL
jgi:hypothetical protein